jgi:hypothetical protein
MSSISITEAAAYTANWRKFNENNNIDGQEVPLDAIFPNAYSVNIADINAIMANSPSKLRIYFGYSAPTPGPLPSGEFAMKVMIVGVNSEGKDMIYSTGTTSGIYDHCQPCPSMCDPSSQLMQDK